jgi:hypothetical protein
MAPLHTLSVQNASHDVIANARQVLDTPAANEHD